MLEDGAFRSAPADADWPEFGLIDDVRPAIAVARSQHRRCALATLVASEGASPRPLGAQMVVDEGRAACGYLSGGCVEGAVVCEAIEIIASKRPKVLVFGAGSPFADVRLLCGSRIEIFIEPLEPDEPAFGAVLDAMRRRRAIVRARAGQGGAPVAFVESADAPQSDARDAGIDADGRYWRRYTPTTRLVIVGGDPVALALAGLGQGIGFEIVLARPLGPAAPPAGFGGRYFNGRKPTDLIETIDSDAWTAFVTTTHDPELDHDVLVAALGAPTLYVGVLGSRKLVPERIERLSLAGLSEHQIAKMHAPVGLSIGAASANEIALSILADIVRARRIGG